MTAIRFAAAALLLAAPAISAMPAAAQQPGVLDLDRAPDEFSEDYFDTTPWDPAYQPPRTADGHPDFGGNWTNVSLTDVDGTEGATKLVVTPREAWDLIMVRTKTIRDDAEATDPDAPPLEVGDADGVGGYNRFWIDPGSSLAVIDGEIRTGWLVEPELHSEFTERGKAMLAERAANRENYDNPEIRAVGERCTTGFGGTAGPPMLNVLYNNIYRFVQGEDTLAIVVEMVHQTRLVRIGRDAGAKANHLPASFQHWLGDSVGWWDGDTLVVHTVGHHPRNMVRARGIIIRPETEVTERFTRVADDTIFYEFTIDDPVVYTRPHKGEMVFKATDKTQYEYACHEGNYSLPGILAGARRQEADAAGDKAAGKD